MTEEKYEFAWGAALKHEGICSFCGKRFVYYRKSTGGTPRKYCSDECAHEARLEQCRQCSKRRRQKQKQNQEQEQINKIVEKNQLQIDAAEAKKRRMSYGQYKALSEREKVKIK